MRRVLIVTVILALILVGVLIGLGKEEKQTFYKVDPPVEQQTAGTFRPVVEPPDNALWLGRTVQGMRAIGQPTQTLPGFVVFYADRDYEQMILGGAGTPHPIPFSVTSYEGDYLATFDDLYEIGELKDQPAPQTRVDTNRMITWFYQEDADRTVVVSVADPADMGAAMSRLTGKR